MLRNKKGASEEGGMVIWIIVAVIAAIVVILFFVGGFDFFKGLFGQAPESLETAVQACKLVASPDTRTSYCDQWRSVEIAGVTQLVNCQYPAIRSKLDIAVDVECPALKDSTKILSFGEKGEEQCAALFRNGAVTEKTRINDVVCSSLGCEEKYGGKLIEKTAKCEGGSKSISKGFKESASKICCV